MGACVGEAQGLLVSNNEKPEQFSISEQVFEAVIQFVLCGISDKLSSQALKQAL